MERVDPADDLGRQVGERHDGIEPVAELRREHALQRLLAGLVVADRIAEAAEREAKAEREAFEKEKADFEVKKQQEQARIEEEKVIRIKEALEAVIIPETIIKDIVVTEHNVTIIPEILVPELPTVNVCMSKEIFNIEVIDAEIVSAKPIETTWDDIANEFKSSGEKSYSKWLKSNYNVPTKL